MPQQLSYPGVYIQEVASGVRTITSVSTSVAAFIGFFKKGRMNEPVQIFGMADFEREFGGLDTRSRASYAIAQFFLNGGSQAYVVRVAEDGTNPLSKAGVTVLEAGGPTPILEIRAANEGEWGNTLRVSINHNTSDPTSLFNLIVARYDSDADDANVVATEEFLELSADSTDGNFVETIVNDGSKLITVEYLPTSSIILPAANGTTGDDTGALSEAQVAGLSLTKFRVQISSSVAGTPPGNPIDVITDDWSLNPIKTAKQFRAKLEQAIRKAAPTVPEYAGASVELVEISPASQFFRVTSGPASSTYESKETISITNGSSGPNNTKVTSLLKLTSGASAFENVQEYQLGFASTEPTVGAFVPILSPVDDGVGSDGELPTPTEIIGSKAVEPYTGMFSLEYVDLFNILCIPRAIEGSASTDLSGPEVTAVISNALAFCREQRAFMIIDIPETINEVAEIKDWLEDNADFRHDNAAVYFPRVQIPDPQNDYRLRSVGASGTMAGIYARTDTNRGVWKSPAGIEATLSGVTDLDVILTDQQNGTLNPLGINCLRTFPIYGSTSWGARTTQGADAIGSEWKYIAVRRLALMLEESLFRGTKWVVFEPNDESLWAKIRMNIGSFLQSLFRQGAFQGTAPKDAYFVKCDKETTTQDDINKGIVNIQVGFAPLKPAEFVVISIQQIAGDV
jgi:phage tail sheath protein FI